MEENTKKPQSKKSYWILTVILVILAFLGGYYYGKSFSEKVTETNIINTPDAEIQNFGDVPPDIFPRDFPFEVGSSLTQSTKTTYKNSNAIQADLTYFSKKTAEENADRFLEYLNQTGWTIINNANDGEIYSLYAQKDREIMNIVMQRDNVTGDLKITVSYTITQ